MEEEDTSDVVTLTNLILLYCMIFSFLEVEVAKPVVQRKKVENRKKPIVLEEIGAMGALHSSVHFLDASCAVGVCRYRTALFCIYFLRFLLEAFYPSMEDCFYELYPILFSLEYCTLSHIDSHTLPS
jgi:hypothetical protein